MPVDEVSPTPAVPRQKSEPEPSVPMTEPIPIVHVMPVQPVVVHPVAPLQPNRPAPIVIVQPPPQEAKVEPEPRIETIRPSRNSEQFGTNNSNNSPKNSEQFKTIPEQPNSGSEFVKKPNETVELTPFERIGKVGRQRKYEEIGNKGENSVREVVLFRHIKGRHYPGLSADMKRWYEFFYFKVPTEGEKPYNANTSYEQHTEAYNRGREWIRQYQAGNSVDPLGDSGLIDLQARRAAH